MYDTIPVTSSAQKNNQKINEYNNSKNSKSSQMIRREGSPEDKSSLQRGGFVDMRLLRAQPASNPAVV